MVCTAARSFQGEHLSALQGTARLAPPGAIDFGDVTRNFQPYYLTRTRNCGIRHFSTPNEATCLLTLPSFSPKNDFSTKAHNHDPSRNVQIALSSTQSAPLRYCRPTAAPAAPAAPPRHHLRP